MNNAGAEQQAWLMSMNLGRQSFQSGRLNDAVNAFRQAAKLQPRRVEGWVNLGSALLETGHYEAAVAALGKAIELRPRLGAAHMLLGDAFRQLGDFTVALRSYREAVALLRTPLTLNKLACALRVQGQVDEARALYLEGIRLDPNFSLAQVNLATLQIEAGKFEAASAQLAELAKRSLPPPEREEVLSSQQSLSEYFRLKDAITTLCTRNDPAPLYAELTRSPEQALGVDEDALKNTRLYIEFARQIDSCAKAVIGQPPQEWPLIEALFMIPLVNSLDEFLDIRAHSAERQNATGNLLESLNMEDAIVAARASREEMPDPVKAELHLRHWHALACRDVPGFLPGHFKYTQNWSTRSPTLKRVDPALASGTFRHFIADLYPALEPGLLRGAVVFMAVCDLHAFADGNGRVAMTWLNRELEWAGLMPALFRRDMGIKGELGKAMREVRVNGGDLTALVEVICRAQAFAVEFCAELAIR